MATSAGELEYTVSVNTRSMLTGERAVNDSARNMERSFQRVEAAAGNTGSALKSTERDHVGCLWGISGRSDYSIR